MSKPKFKSHASSGRLGGFGGFGGSAFSSTQASTLSYIQEPLDYSQISNANIVVAFKNLSKKDSTTKAKALEDLQSNLVGVDDEIDDGTLEAWVKVFPRLSIDNARRVRQLAFQLNGQVCAKCGKRIVTYLPRLVGSWLAGEHDADRTVSRSAHDALKAVFPTPEKVAGLRKTFHAALLDYCRDALLKETTQSLSDERVVSVEDAEATYARAVSSSIALVSNLLETLPVEDIAKQVESYRELTSEAKFWDFATHSDASVRRALHRLTRACGLKHPKFIEENLQSVSTAYIYKALPSDQTSSALELMLTVELLTNKFPAVWTDAYTGKKPALPRLRSCLRHGSYAGPASFWETLARVLPALPTEMLPSKSDEIIPLLEAARDGANKKEERLNGSAAWSAYVALLITLVKSAGDDQSNEVLEAAAVPLVKQFVLPSEDTATWSVPGPKSSPLIATVVMMSSFAPFLDSTWKDLTSKVIELAKLSQPEQSSTFEKSQKQVALSGERLTDLQKEIYKQEPNDTTKALLASCSRQLMGECTNLIRSRNGKPFGAAAIIEQQLRQCGDQLLRNKALQQLLLSFARDDVPSLFYSASQKQLAGCLDALSQQDGFEQVSTQILQSILDGTEDLISKLQAIQSLYSLRTSKAVIISAQEMSTLQDFLVSCVKSSEPGVAPALSALLRAGVASTTTTDAILSQLTTSLALEDDRLSSNLTTLEQLANNNAEIVKHFLAGHKESSTQLLPNVLLLEHSSDDQIATRASVLSTRLTTAIGDTETTTKTNLILQNFTKTSNKSLPIDAVLDLADRLLDDSQITIDDVLPDSDLWQAALLAVLRPPEIALSVSSPFGGAVSLVQGDHRAEADQTHYDSDGFSAALRIAIFSSRFLSKSELVLADVTDLPRKMALLSITTVAAEDVVSIPGSNGLSYPSEIATTETDILQFIVESNNLQRTFQELKSLSEASPEGVLDAYFGSFEDAKSLASPASPFAYYAALASVRSRQNLYTTKGFSSAQCELAESQLRSSRSSREILPLIATIVGYSQPLEGGQLINRTCNELIAELTAIDLDTRSDRAFEALVTLNAVAANQEDIISSVAKPRLIFLFKHIIPWAATESNSSLKAEVYKVLTHIVPAIEDMYGEHWTQMSELLTTYWKSIKSDSQGSIISTSEIPLLHASLRLFGALKRLSEGTDANDDLQEAIQSQKDQIYTGFTNVLTSLAGVSDEHHEPMQMTTDLLARQILRLPYHAFGAVHELYPIVCAASLSVQNAAFGLLHQHISATQEQVSFDAAIDNKTARLPDELLSLVISPPSPQASSTSSFRSYLFGWRLLFDHFPKSSFRVKSDYVEQLKDNTVLPGLLSLIFDLLGHTRGRPIDVTKYNVQEYQADLEPDVEKDSQWLLAHLFYLSTLYLPSLVQQYVREVRSRQTSGAIESFTAKSISPPIIAASLEEVATWAETSVKEDPDYESMTVKVGLRSREINVSYLVDEQTMAIKVVLPEAYPLESAKVVSVNRVAVKEEKWQSWLRNCQGVIVFSNGSIVDGLTAWRKNVTGALKGQTECAICYSIISGDKELPTKRCPTCKNLFHSGCLYKWFKTSNASTCPLCRNPFNFN